MKLKLPAFAIVVGECGVDLLNMRGGKEKAGLCVAKGIRHNGKAVFGAFDVDSLFG